MSDYAGELTLDGIANSEFLAKVTDGIEPDPPVLCLCRSGARSLAAARTPAAGGYPLACNLSARFEGDLDVEGHRNSGWKQAGLPWRQG